MNSSIKNANLVWLASYPRSGNTFLRTILWHCFGLRSSSIYQNDLGGNKELENYVGHIERTPGKPILFPNGGIPLVKTHEHDNGGNPAIYVIRDGRAACISLWNFYKCSVPLESVIEGKNRFGTWSSHVESWNPWQRPNTLLLEYEDLRQNLQKSLSLIGEFLGRDILKKSIPDRQQIASVDGRWVRKISDWRASLIDDDLRKFNEINRKILAKAGYGS